MAGGVNPSDPTNRMDNAEHAGMAFFRDKVAALLNQNWFKCLLLVFYFVYIVGAAWGCYNIQEGLDKRNTANHDSYSVQYYNMDDAYFKEYAYTINVMIHGPNIDFSQIEVQKRVENIVSALEDSVYIDGNSTQNWLANFLDYVDRNKGYSDVNLPVETPEEFADTLKNVYLADPNNPERLDVAFTDDGTRVKAARFIIQVRLFSQVFDRDTGPVSFEFSQNSSSQLHNQLLELYLWPKFINPSKIARTSCHRSREVKITKFFSSKKAKSVS